MQRLSILAALAAAACAALTVVSIIHASPADQHEPTPAPKLAVRNQGVRVGEPRSERGAIISAAPNLQPVTDLLGTDVATVRKALNGWGPGKFDAELSMDGKAFRPDGKSACGCA